MARPTYAKFPSYTYQSFDTNFVKYTNIPLRTPKRVLLGGLDPGEGDETIG
jgi:hypothetical protein